MRTADQAEGLRATSRRSDPSPRRDRLDAAGRAVIAVSSGKGGVGKTQIAANLAVAFASKDLRVLLVDADVGLASLDLALGLRPRRNLLHVLAGECAAVDALCEGPAGTWLLPACPGRYEMANLDLGHRRIMSAAIEEVAAQFDVLIVDTGAGIGSNAVAFASWATDLLLVTTPDPTSIRDAYAMAKVLNGRAGMDRMSLVANQVSSVGEGVEIFDRVDSIVRQFLPVALDYAGSIPRDELVVKAARSGTPFLLRAPDGPAARAIDGIARRMTPTAFSMEMS